MKRSLLLVVMLAGTMACTPAGPQPTSTTTPTATSELREAYLPELWPVGNPLGLADLEVDASRYPSGATIEAKGGNLGNVQAGTYCLSIRIEGASTSLAGSETCTTVAGGSLALTTNAVPLPQGVFEYRLASTCDGSPCGAFLGAWTRIRW